MTQPSLDSFFSGGGGKSISWKDMPVGTRQGGRIKAIAPPSQVTDLVTKEPKVKKNGEPVMHVRITLATAQRDPSDPEDDGSRNLYAQGWMIGAIGDAVRRAGAEGSPQVGGDLWVTLTERTPPETPGLNPTNKFAAEYTPPAPAATQQFFAQQVPQGLVAPTLPPQQQAPVQYAPAFVQPQQAYAAPALQSPVEDAPPWAQGPVPAAQPPVMTPEQVAAFMAQQVPAAAPAEPEPPKPAAISQQAWDQMPLETKKSVAATMAAMPSM